MGLPTLSKISMAVDSGMAAGVREQIAIIPPYAHMHIHVTGNKNRHTCVIKFGLVFE
jgi:hypothetical protein